jgi:hypothetical protein
MTALRRGVCLVALACTLVAPPLARATEGPLEIAALTWLELLDQSRFDDAWREGAPLLRDGVTQQQWVDATKKLRAELGPVAERTVVDKAYHQQIEGGPDGHYFTLRIRSRLASGGERVEIVTLTAGADQQYRAAAYGIKR